MDLYKQWDHLNETKFNNAKISKQEIMNAINKKSQLSLDVLKKGLKIKMYWITFFVTILAVWMLSNLDKTELMIILSFPLILYIIGLILTRINYNKLRDGISLTAQTADVIKMNVSIIKSTLRMELINSIFGMPIFVITGLLVANYYQGNPLSAFFHNQFLLVTAVVCLIILVPVGILAGAKMNEAAFGKHLHHLQENIIELEALK